MIGICNLSNIPLRREPDSRSEIASQVLFGETFEVMGSENGWTHIVTQFDNYTGWISSRQFKMLNSPIRHIETAGVFPFIKATSKDGNIMIPPGSVLPNLEGNSFQINDTQYQLETANQVHTASDLVPVAKQYEHVPYLWGGRTPFGIDCSGFVQAVFRQCGLTLERDSFVQATQGETVSFLAEAKTGDLAFFDNEAGKIIHVGMLLDDRTIIHASGEVRIDPIDNYGIMNKDDHQYSHKLRIIRRIKA